MNIVDVIIVIIFLLAFFWGFKKGLLVTLTSLIGLILGLYVATYFSHFLGGYLDGWFNWSGNTTKWVAFALTFLLVVFLLNLVGKFLTTVADFTAMGLLNKLLGGVFSTLQYVFILSVVFLFFNGPNFTGYEISEERKENSKLYGSIASFAPLVLPRIIEKFDVLKQDHSTGTEKYELK